MCQRPKRASFISTICSTQEYWLTLLGVNALNGLLSFLLTDWSEADKVIDEECQRPKQASFISTENNGKKARKTI